MGRDFRFFGLLLISGFLLFVTGCDSFIFSDPDRQKRPLQIATNVWPGYEPLYLARALGKLDPKKVRLVEMTSSSQVIRNLRNGLVQGGCLTMDEQLTLMEYGMNVDTILIMDVSHGADVIIAQKGIANIQKLKGKRVGLEDSALGAYVLARALEINDLQADELKLVSLNISEHLTAFRQDQVDAVVTFEPIRSILLREGGKQIFDSSQMPGEIVDVLLVTKEAQQTHGEEVKHLIDAWFFALEFIKTNPQKAYELMAPRLQLKPTEVPAVFEGLKLPTRQENLDMMEGERPPLLLTRQMLLQTMQEKGLVKKGLELPNGFHSEFLK